MNEATSTKTDVLNEVGNWFLQTIDARWVIIGAIVFVVAFWLLLRWRKKRSMSREDAISLGQAVLNLYSAPVLFCLLVLSDPPVFDPAKKSLYQSAGFLASLFLAFGVLKQIGKAWTDGDKDKPNSSGSTGESHDKTGAGTKGGQGIESPTGQ
jgi:uncharacterized membrane protein YfcA